MHSSIYITNLAVLAAVALSAFVLVAIVQRLTKPIAKVPGPWYSLFTSWVHKYHWLNGNSAKYVHSLHDKYGPVVRILPDQVSLAELDDVKTVYTTKETFKKSRWYTDLTPVPIPNVFTTRDVDVHRRYRRLLAGPMSESSLRPVVSEVQRKCELCISKMAEEMQSRGAADIAKWWLFFTTDTIGDLTFGSSFQMLMHGEKNQYFRDLQSVGNVGRMRIAFPGLMKLAPYIPLPVVSKVAQAGIRIRNYAIESLKRQERSAFKDPSASDTLLSKVIKAKQDETMTFNELVVNAQSYIIAGTDTTSNALTYLVWLVCSHPDIQEQLVKEVQTLNEDFTEADTRELRYLDQVIKETLRLHGSVPAMLPRTVPPGGTLLGGYALDEGTTVGTQSYTMHRDHRIFPNPGEFNPSRWKSATKDMTEATMPFGRGPRICIGLHLALIEIRLGAVTFFRRFPHAKMSTREGMSNADMEPAAFFLQAPSGGRCLIEGFQVDSGLGSRVDTKRLAENRETS